MIRTPMVASGTDRFSRIFAVCCSLSALLMACQGLADVSAAEEEPAPDSSDVQPADPVSFHLQVEPILRSKCQGCHQPAKPQGGMDLTSLQSIYAAGESGEVAVIPGDPENSELMRQITPEDGWAAMPKDLEPLHPAEIELIRSWILQGAKDDSPPGGTEYSRDNPPKYRRAPLITSLAFSPDGKWLAVNGYHESLLVDAESFQTKQRLVGLSGRIESLAFSPDSNRLAVTGGASGKFGEVQIWSIPDGNLLLSQQLTFDTLFGGAFSPDARLFAFGATDRAVRAIDVETGVQKLYQGAHEDWSLATVFNPDGTHLISAGRDRTVKLTEVATERFVDNITSITPGALKGGVSALAIHPKENQVLVGGADGIPKIYRIFRETQRRIGDDANLIRQFPPMLGRIFSVAISGDGQTFAVASTLDGSSQIKVYPFDFTGEMPEEVKTAQAKAVGQRSAEDQQLIDQFISQTSPAVTELELPESLYAVAFHPSGTMLAAGGAGGMVHVFSVPSGELITQVIAVPIESIDGTQSPSLEQSDVASSSLPSVGSGLATSVALYPDSQQELQHQPESQLVRIEVHPEQIRLQGFWDTAQLVVSAVYADGRSTDITRLAKIAQEGQAIQIDAMGLVRGSSLGEDRLLIEFRDQTVRVPVVVEPSGGQPVDFIRDVNPILSKLGCNSGTCHGAQQGKNGFQLSLRGYDPEGDIRALSDDLRARRLNSAVPEASLMLLKPTGEVPHEGGVLLSEGSVYYEVLRKWIAEGARLERTTPKVERIEIIPSDPVIEREEGWQQFRVVAHYPDGLSKDVTGLAFLESSDSEVCESLPGGRVRALRRGEAALLARYEGAYAAASITVMGDRAGFVWQQPEAYNAIDELVAAKWERMKILPSDLCEDHVFLRRVQLDLTGLPPTKEQLKSFLADPRPSRIKRQAKVEELLGSDDYIEHWTNKWADLLQVNSKFLGSQGAASLRAWIRSAVADNVPYDQFASQILTASGSTKENPPASYYKILREPDLLVENTTHLFLAVRFNCNKCHDHPFEKWTQDQYFELAAYFAQTGLKADPASGDQRIGGSAVEGAKPLYEEVFDKDAGEMRHERTGKVVEPSFPFDCDHEIDDQASRRETLAAWITSQDNPYFATSFVNRLWGYLTGRGLIEPLDDIRAGNPPSNPELLQHLTREFIESDFNIQHILRMICNSRTYQLSIASNSWNEDDHLNYSRAKARRLPAEVLYDAIHRVTGAQSEIPGVEPGLRAAQLPDVAFNPPDGFLNNLGRPVRESACECERSDELQLGPIMALVSGPTLGMAIGSDKNDLADLAGRDLPRQDLVEEVYLRVLNRYPDQAEVDAVLQMANEIESDHALLQSRLEEMEQSWKQQREQLEAERLQKLEAAQLQAQQRETEIAPERERMEKERQEKIAQAQKTLDEYSSRASEVANEFLRSQATSNHWFPLAPTALQSSNNAKLTPLPDRSISVSGGADKGTYTLRFQTPLTGIRGFRLEALPIDAENQPGPGLSANGNFVVTEIEVHAAPLTAPEQRVLQRIAAVKADFTQEGFAATAVFDGNASDQGGWAIHPRGGVAHWATFQFAEPIQGQGGVELSFEIHQNHQAAEHRLGRFRISVTTDEGEIQLGLPEEFAAVSVVPEQDRSPEQLKLLVDYLEKSDPKWNELKAALATANSPLAPDEPLVALRELVEQLKVPVQDPAELVQLRADFAASREQMSNRRLTLTQDLTWALINSPAFLFNH
jgi:WD40 repeat protein